MNDPEDATVIGDEETFTPAEPTQLDLYLAENMNLKAGCQRSRRIRRSVWIYRECYVKERRVRRKNAEVTGRINVNDSEKITRYKLMDDDGLSNSLKSK